MNLQQLEYIDALAQTGHFGQAAARCFVTQPTLSMMIKKLEEELGVQIFQRNQQPIVPTREGREIVAYARKVLHQAALLREYAAELRNEVSGPLRIGIIPTLAPYLAPLFIQRFAAAYPQLEVTVKEMFTNDLIKCLHHGELDVGLAATPLQDPMLNERSIFDEELLAYASESEGFTNKRYVTPHDINPDHLWLLEEGHCLRNQVFNLCELRQIGEAGGNLRYEAGSIETLVNLVDVQGGLTIVPRLAALLMTPEQQTRLHHFCDPRPSREISLITLAGYPRKRLVEALHQAIQDHLPKAAMAQQGLLNRLSIR